MIRLENITKIYNEKVDDTKALDDVSLKIEDGEFISVMGASGSGKSTLLKIIGWIHLQQESIFLMILRLLRQAVHRYISCARKRLGMCSSILH